jgi:DNA-directed RNA polymerase specialized sigma24 family protein
MHELGLAATRENCFHKSDLGSCELASSHWLARSDAALCKGWPDHELVRLILAGSDEARDELLCRHYHGLRQHARSVAAHDADDLVHDALLRSLDDLEQLHKPECYLHWVQQMITDMARALRKNRSRHLALDTAPDQQDIGGLMPTEAPATTHSDLNYLLALLERESIRSGRHRVSISRTMLESFHEHGQFPTVGEIERSTGLSHGNVQRGRQDLLKCWRRLCREAGFKNPLNNPEEK